MTEFNNGLTPAQAERLALLAEECGEVVQAVAKILRHGYESGNPLEPGSLSNRERLAVKLGQLSLATIVVGLAGDVDSRTVGSSRDDRAVSVGRWLHHQDVDLLTRLRVTTTYMTEFADQMAPEKSS